MGESEIVMAGFGGQGLLFSGKVLAYAGLLEGRQLSWLPSYGPEMRGGTANCNVILSDNPIGSPIAHSPNILMVMNNPSFDKYEGALAKGGFLFIDSSLVSRQTARKDVASYAIPATRLAGEMGFPSLANMILTGALVKATGCVRMESAIEALRHVVSARKADLLDANIKAIRKGEEYV